MHVFWCSNANVRIFSPEGLVKQICQRSVSAQKNNVAVSLTTLKIVKWPKCLSIVGWIVKYPNSKILIMAKNDCVVLYLLTCKKSPWYFEWKRHICKAVCGLWSPLLY